jgi:Uma2 family endonuclease
MAEPLPKTPADGEPETDPLLADPFRYGSRWRSVRLPNGEVTEQLVPLTAEDLLDPELGDEVTQSGPHAKLATTVHDLLERFFEPRPDVLVTFDMKILWGIPGLPNPSPDVMVIPGIRDRDASRSTFVVAAEKTLPSLIIEVVSYSDTAIRLNDYEKKVEIYERVGIPEYLIADPPFSADDRLLLTGYRLGPDGRYRKIEPDPWGRWGRLFSETAGLWFGVSEDGRTIRIFDAATGERLLNSREEAAARKQEAAAREREAQARERETEARKAAEAEVARLRAELERLRKSAE